MYANSLTREQAGTQLRGRLEPVPAKAAKRRRGKVAKAQRVHPLVAELLDAMHLEAIAYCHWKSNWRLDEWLAGKGDLDLLVAREDAPRFESLIYGLGFKRTTVSGGKELPGVVNYYGYRRSCDRLVHIHAHYSLVAGHDASKNYRFP